MKIHLHRAYELETIPAGYRVLVDRLWPRGIRKDDLPIDAWAKEIAPSTALRTWFAHEPSKWAEFKKRYRAELNTRRQELDRLIKAAEDRDLILIYSARDTEHNQAVVLGELLEATF